ncbi:hypothetical protein CWO17_15515 [Vibrio sp. 10N.286.45.A3]|uniref:hypothetical protein n=1 Tax=Vibrio TaxID=662 RepID=UPI000D3D8917|nr:MULTISPECIES: hypothetical protein [Vibrio]PTP01502.1 hypothetical protein CWO17_15515 [Vibrio sp. 10N.286.45.A3]TKE82360.1 hypothetical protein FCV56_12505 [Vibrio sp. F12]TKE98188.1 hypothetical protein FCV61_11915 [Vibrio sp. F12]TKF95746.1 hypothetical protein FCV71_15415 [Vibrio lentus]
MDIRYVLAALAVCALLFLLGTISETIQTENRKKRDEFRKALKLAVISSQPSWEQVLDIAEVLNVSSRTAYEVSMEIYKEILTGENEELKPYQELVEDYLLKHREAEPFEGLPAETRIHLERLSEAIQGTHYSLEPLTMQIKELVSIYEKDKRTQRRYTVWGFFIGLAGFMFAAYSFFVSS